MKSAETIFRQHLKEKGMLVSRQQEQILATFMKTKNHPTVDDLYESIRKKDSKIGLATVYRAMRVICNLVWQKRLISETAFVILSISIGVSIINI